MRIAIIIISLLCIACNKIEGQRVIAGIDKTAINFNILIDGGTFYPSQTATPQVTAYQNYEYGWLIHYNMNVYNGHWYDQRLQVPPPATDFNPSTVNVEKWADTAQARDLDYAAITVINEYGFVLYPSVVDYNMPRISLGSGYSPYYTAPYCVQPSADTGFLRRFVHEFSQRGIEPVFYFGFGGNSNLAQVTSGQMWDAAVPSERQELFVQYYCKLAQEMARKYPRVKYYWVDIATNLLPAGSVQRIYNAFKSINPQITIVGNALGESDFSRFPYDIASVEEYIAYNNQSFISGNTLSYNGTTYYVPREIVGTMYSDYSQWYYYDELVPDPPVNNPFTGTPPYVKMQGVSTSTFQGLVNVAKNANRPFNAVMMVDRDGNLVQQVLNYHSQISFKAN